MYEESDDDDDTDVKNWRARTAAQQQKPSMSNNLRSQLVAIADQFERTKLNEQSILNRRIQTLTAEKKAAETERDEVKSELKEKEKELTEKLEAKEAEAEEWKGKAEKAEAANGATTKRALALQFIVAELVGEWPMVPVYDTPAIEDDSDNSDLDSDEEAESVLKLELDDEDEDESIDGEANGDSPTAKKKKKKKRGKRGGKKKKATDEEALMASADGAALPPPPGAVSLAERPPPPAVGELAKKKAPRAAAPTITRHEKAPLPPGLVLPTGLLTRRDFMDLTGCAGLTQKQLNKLHQLLEPGDPALSGSSNDEELLVVVDEALGGGLNACCGASGSLRIAKLLLAHGANPSYMGQEFDASPVHRSIQFGHDNLFALLLTHKVNINATDPVHGRTPLHFSAEYNRPTLAKLLVQKGAMVDAVDNNGETATQIAERLKWKKVATILTDPSVLFWNFANRANKLYKATEYDLAIAVYERSFALLDEVKPLPSAQNRATLHYNCARAAANIGRQLSALEHCNLALAHVPKYLSALEQRAKCNLALYNYKAAVDDATSLMTEGSDASSGPSTGFDLWARIKRDSNAKLAQSHFDLLGITKAATAAEVKKAYRTQCIAWHPDKHVSSEDAKHRAHFMFQRVNEAHEVLSDPTKRRTYEYTHRFTAPAQPNKTSPAQRTSPYAGYSGGWPYKSQYESDEDEDEDGNL